MRVIAGEIGGGRGPGDTYTPITVAHATVAPGARLVVHWPQDFNALAYVLSGGGTAGGERGPVEAGQLIVFGPRDTVVVESAALHPLDVLLLGGRPIREPVAAHGPFVMNTREELSRAFADYAEGRLGTIPPDGLQPYRA